MLPKPCSWGVILSLLAASVGAQDWTLGRWHHVTEGSPFYTEDRAYLHSAAILQDDGRFALMVLGKEEDGALVSVNLPMSDIASSLTSTLVMPDGNILVRDAADSQFIAERDPDGQSVTYSFGIAPEDIEQFMAAQMWRVQAGDTLTTISLDGSRDAITQALAARDAEREPMGSDQG
jgi:hypothetical protein